MNKKYNLGSQSDIRRFSQDMGSAMMSQAHNALMNRKYDITCPHCQRKVSVPPGRSACPHCRAEINLSLDIH